MLVVGFLLGGTVGIGTVLYALTIGPIVQLFLPWVQVPVRRRPEPGDRPRPARREAGRPEGPRPPGHGAP